MPPDLWERVGKIQREIDPVISSCVCIISSCSQSPHSHPSPGAAPRTHRGRTRAGDRTVPALRSTTPRTSPSSPATHLSQAAYLHQPPADVAGGCLDDGQRLVSSCATPAAICPSDTRRADCRSCISSSRASSVRASWPAVSSKSALSCPSVSSIP